VTVSINPSNLQPGTYNGTVLVAGANGAGGSTTINVTLEVTVVRPTIDGVTNAASYASNGNVAPGEVITIFGSNIGPSNLIQAAFDSTGKIATTLGNTQVLVGGYLAPLVYVRSDQVAAIVPYEIASPFLIRPNVVVKYLGQSSNGVPLNQVAAVPGIFTALQSGSGPGAILNGDSHSNTEAPADKGSVIQIFLTGEGQTSPGGSTGSITTATLKNGSVFTPQPVQPVGVLIDNIPAQLTFVGEVPGIVAGVLQVNAVVPANARSGAVPIVVTVGTTATQNGVTVNLK
jgi:uncharacterized protein (TIGR03437 family)